MFLNEEFIKLYEELTALNEAKEDQEKFIAKFGQDAFDAFWNKKQLLKNKGFNTDITYHVARTSPEEMQKILDSVSDAVRKTEIDAEGKPIPENTNNFEIVYDGPHYTVFKPLDYVASIHCAHGGRWCVAGGYGLPEGQVKVSQAQQYFNSYTRDGIVLYYFIGKYGSGDDRYALAYNENHGTGKFFDYDDSEVDREDIPYLDEVEIPDLDLESLWSGYVCEDCGDQIEDGEEYFGPNGECYCDYCFLDKYFFCADCGEATDLDDCLQNPDGDSICMSCFENSGYAVCEECDTVCEGCDTHEVTFSNTYLLCDSCYQELIESGTEEGLAEKFTYISYYGNADDFTDAKMLETIIACWNDLKHSECGERFIELAEDTFIANAFKYAGTVVDPEVFNADPDNVAQYIKIAEHEVESKTKPEHASCHGCNVELNAEDALDDFVGEGNFYCTDCWFDYLATDKYGMVEAVILMVENNELFPEVDSLAAAKRYLDNWYKYKDECLPKSRYAVNPRQMKKISDSFADSFTELVQDAGLT